MGDDEGLELDETDKEEEVCDGDEEQVEEDEGEDVRGIQSGWGRQENCRERSSRHLEFQLSREQVLVNLP